MNSTVLLIFGAVLIVTGIDMVYLVNSATGSITIDCSNPVYPKNLTRTIEIMKYCTGGEKETP